MNIVGHLIIGDMGAIINACNEPSQHAHFDQARFKAELNRLNLGLIGSEFSQTEPGYIAGALDHVNEQAAKIKNQCS